MQIFFAGWTRKTDLKVGGAGVKEREGGCPTCHAGAELCDLQIWISGAGEEGARADALVKFWGFAGRLAKMHRGRCLQELPLFLQEVAFRLNQRDNPQITETLCRLLESD
jgi:hypothetical protein